MMVTNMILNFNQFLFENMNPDEQLISSLTSINLLKSNISQALFKYGSEKYNLLPSEIMIIYYYTTGMTPTIKNSSNEIKNLLIRALDKLPNFNGDVVRVVDYDDDLISYLKTNKIISNKDSFWSASSDLNWKGNDLWSLRNDNKTIIFNIKSKTGKDILAFSSHKFEKEVLFTFNKKFEIISSKINKDCYIYNLKEV